MANNNLTSAKKARNDEFYTQYEDIQKEVQAYIDYNPDVFRGKVVYLNCDDPYESNFFKFFANKFNAYGIKKLIATSYFNSPVAGTELQSSLLPDMPDKEVSLVKKSAPQTNTTTEDGETKGRVIEITEVSDENGDGIYDLEDIKKIIQANGGGRSLKGDDDFPPGDFRSKECVELLKQADIVVTNPPFSLFREYVAQLFEYDKKFLIIGNMNAITYKEIFPKIKENKMWLGVTGFNQGMFFFVPDDFIHAKTYKFEKKGPNGRKINRVAGVCWFANIDHGKRHQPLELMSMEQNKKFNNSIIKSELAYKKYDNYDAIEVPLVQAIPNDYDGAMGVPITFLDKYSPDQFEILGATESEGKGFSNGLWDEKSRVSQPVIERERESIRESLSAIRIPNQEKYDRPYIEGKRLYFRILIKRRKGIKDGA